MMQNYTQNEALKKALLNSRQELEAEYNARKKRRDQYRKDKVMKSSVHYKDQFDAFAKNSNRFGR